MNQEYQTFLSLLDQEKKDEAILFIHDLLKQGMDLIDMYENFLVPSLANYACDNESEDICIWKEHTRTSIVRTILDSTYPYLIEAKKRTPVHKLIVIACPEEEYHEIGALVAANYFYLMGYQVKYIGANTPGFEIKSALKVMKPNYLALSITNYYHLMKTKHLVEDIKKDFPNIEIILGGQAIKKYAETSGIHYDYILNSYDDIKAFRGDHDETSL